jgi:tetratricopeptide (TPR) repeat protein
MQLEGKKDFAAAMDIYAELLKHDENDINTRKRVTAILMQTDKKGAIESLVEYLDTYMHDHEAWSQLASLYLDLSMYKQAAFCYEELLLLRPLNHLSHIQFADVQYTLKNYPLALKHYCRAFELCDDNVRSHYGILLCLKNAPNDKLKQIVISQLTLIYKHENSKMLPLLKKYLS